MSPQQAGWTHGNFIQIFIYICYDTLIQTSLAIYIAD